MSTGLNVEQLFWSWAWRPVHVDGGGHYRVSRGAACPLGAAELLDDLLRIPRAPARRARRPGRRRT